jgi:hypothetical protein
MNADKGMDKNFGKSNALSHLPSPPLMMLSRRRYGSGAWNVLHLTKTVPKTRSVRSSSTSRLQFEPHSNTGCVKIIMTLL